MAKLLKFKSFNEFYRHNIKHMKKHFYVYFHVFKLIERLETQEEGVYNAYNVVDDEGHEIIAIHATGSYYLFSFGWTPQMLDLVEQEVDVTKCKANFDFLGQRDLIFELLQRHECQWRVFKDRLIYQCTEVVGKSKPRRAVVENASVDDIHKLAAMTLAYSIEEYPDRPHRDEEKAYGQVMTGIESNSMFVVKNGSDICSILQVIHTPQIERPLLGSLYTLPNMRNKGYATLLVRTVTEGLLAHRSKVCGLLSDRLNPASNKAFVNVGYKPVYHWASVVME